MPDVDGLAEVEVCSQLGEVIGVVIHVVALVNLRRAAVPAPVVGDHPVTVMQEEEHLGIPVIGRERPAVAEDDRCSLPPSL